MNTVGRVIFPLLLAAVGILPASAQTVLTFPHVIQTPEIRTGFSIANPSQSVAELTFSLYSLDGSLVAGLANPVRYRIQARGTLSIFADEVFAVRNLDGWVRVTSTTPGLAGHLFRGDFLTGLDGAVGLIALADQIVPWLGNSGTGELRVVNVSSDAVSVGVVITNDRGNVVDSLFANLDANAGISFSTTKQSVVAGENLSARITASAGVIAQAVVEEGGSVVFVNGQPVTVTATTRFAPHVMLGNGFDSTLVVANPSNRSVTVLARLLDKDGGPVHFSLSEPAELSLKIPANGSISVGATQFTGLVFAPFVNGWIEVRSPNVSLGSILVLEQGPNRTTYPLQSVTIGKVAYPQLERTSGLVTGLVLVNSGALSSRVSVAFVDVGGNTIARSEVEVASNSKHTSLVRELLPALTSSLEGILTVDAVGSIYGIEIIGHETGGLLAASEAQPLKVSSEPVVILPSILDVSRREGRPGDQVRIQVANLGDAGTVMLGGLKVPARFLAPGMSIRIFDIPEIAAGYVDLWLRSEDGIESERVSMLVMPNDTTSLKKVRGRAFYEKVDVGRDGLNLAGIVMVPIRHVRVDVVDRQTGQLVSVAETDENGHFLAAVPEGPDYNLRVLSQLKSSQVVVADNTNGGAIFYVGSDVDTTQAPVLFARDTTRVSGAFNILEVLRQGNAFVDGIESELQMPQLTIFWSPNNKPQPGNPFTGAIGGTFFNVSDSTAFILGDRDTDSDEFDDAVILHEYAHMLAVSFSSDDSSGGEHELGDVLDPRVAWSEGWANFFSAAVRHDPIYRDSFGQEGTRVLEYDLEVDILAGDQPGFWSEVSVHSILWDLFDGNVDAGDVFQLPFRSLWSAFRSLKGTGFVYLHSFLDRLIVIDPAAATMLDQMAPTRSIDFPLSTDHSISNPFPRLHPISVPAFGAVDSLSTQRSNLAQSAHLYAVDLAGGAVSIRLDVTGLGPGQNPNANDLDLFLLDETGRVVNRSDRGLDGQSELISSFLPTGRYVIEVRSFYTNGDTGALVFNSGAYQLVVRFP